MFRRWASLLGVLSVLLSVSRGGALGQVQYNVTDLGTLGGLSSYAYGINASGQVVGGLGSGSGPTLYGAFLYSNGAMTGLDAVGAYGINASGQVVGYAETNGNYGYYSAFLYSNGSMKKLGALGGNESFAFGINANGQVVGYATTMEDDYQAFLYSNGSMTDLGTLPGFLSSGALGINASGQVVGWAGNYAFLYSNGSMTNLGTLPGYAASEACSINAGGQVVGFSWTAGMGSNHGFLYSNGGMTDLGTLPGYQNSEALGINASGQVVGYAYTASGGSASFLYSNDVMTDLNRLITTSGWTLEEATGINDNGQICGYGVNPAGQTDAFLLTPVPEPSTLVLLGIGSFGLLAFAWRRRGRARCLSCAAVVVAMLIAGSAQADVFNMGGTRDPTTGTWTGVASFEFVTVGDPGNAADTTGYGSVPYTYQMGKYDVTVGQYCQFLNAVAKTDTYGLYSWSMAGGIGHGMPTVGIAQSGLSGSYGYSVTGGYGGTMYSQAANCPVFDVSWYDAVRFCNWLQNGQPAFPAGVPGEVAGSTETGAYTLGGNDALRNAGATYFIPTQNERYKAAYYDPTLNSDIGGYWAYTTKCETLPINVLSSSGTNNANFYDWSGTGTGTNTDTVNFLTPVGAFAASPGPYGTFDMGGDVWQWTEGASFSSGQRYLLGGALSYPVGWLAASVSVYFQPPIYTELDTGFRVASLPVPEPGSIMLLVAGGLCLAAFAWRRRRKLHDMSPMSLPWIVALAAGVAHADSWSTATLSQARDELAATSVGNKVLFAGGNPNAISASNVVDIYDTVSNTWSTAQLSLARCELEGVSAGGKALFAGGFSFQTNNATNVVDIYDAASNTWSTAQLSQARQNFAATSVGDEVFFGGGITSSYPTYSNGVDIYDTTSNTWSTASLSEGRCWLAAASAGGKVVFGGGWNYNAGGASNVVDIYDTQSGVWSTATLSQARDDLAAVSIGDQVFFAGGGTGPYGEDPTDEVDIYNTSSAANHN